jgi:hypothetical protein
MANRAIKVEDEKLPAPIAGTALEVVDFGDAAGLGAEDLGMDDQLTPLLRILHYQCPQIDRHDPKFIPGAAPGNICDVSSGQCWDGEEVGLDVVVCGVKRRYGEWIPRDGAGGGGGGFRGFHEVEDPTVQKLLFEHGKFKPLPWVNGAGERVELVETGELFVLFAPPPLTYDNASRALVNFTSTSLAGWKQYNRLHSGWRFKQTDGSMKAGPVCAWRWRLRSQSTQNSQGRFFVWRMDLSSKVANPDSGPLDNRVVEQEPALYEMALDSLHQYRSGQVSYQQTEEVARDDAPPF